MDSKQVMAGSHKLDIRASSVALARIISEVAAGGELSAARGYNRTHNRHNR